MVNKDTLDGWTRAAKADNYSYLIHPTGTDPKAYDESGKQYAELILEPVKPKDVVMDYGCGNGRILRHIREPKVGIDIVPEAAKMVGGFTPSEFKGKVDVIYTVNVLIHNPYEVGCEIIKWMHARLKKGGTLLLQMPVYDEAKDPLNYIDVGVWTLEMLMDATEGFRPVQVCVNEGKFSYEKIGPHHFDFHIFKKL